ncbi:hypothetical protein F5Y12DRAFT_774414 [Xylaria sp. FL1777]|nr:hypothetical protein F5Y12DRAFT_774414 [Xylaria sp. FL1777]
MTNLGPLTTTYIPSGTGCQSTNVGITTGASFIQRGTVSSCFPSGFNSYPAFYFSPGICQMGYTYACSGAVGLPGVTGATCCPTGFTCLPNLRDNDPNPCGSTFTSTGLLSVDVLSYTTGVPTKIGATTWAYTSGDLVFAKGLAVRRAASDLEWSVASTETTATTSTQPSSTPRVTSSPTASAASQTPRPSTSVSGDAGSGISTGVIIGISVSLGIVGLLLLVGLIIAAYRCGKRKGGVSKKNKALMSDDPTDGAWVGRWKSAHEMEEQRRIQELRVSRDPAELAG